jgi:hypothetical protein
VLGDFNCVEREVPFEIIRGGTTRAAATCRARWSCSSTPCRGLRFRSARRPQVDVRSRARPARAHYRGAAIHNEALGDRSSATRRAPSPEATTLPWSWAALPALIAVSPPPRDVGEERRGERGSREAGRTGREKREIQIPICLIPSLSASL